MPRHSRTGDADALIGAHRASGREFAAAGVRSCVQGVRGSTQALLDGSLLSKLKKHISSTGGSYTAG